MYEMNLHAMETMSTRLTAILLLLLLPSFLHLRLPPAEAEDVHRARKAFYKIVLRNTTPNKTLEADCEGIYDPPSLADRRNETNFSLPFSRNRRMMFARSNRRLVVACTFKDLSSGCWAEGVQVFNSSESKCFSINGGCRYEFRNSGDREFLFSVEDGQVLGFFPNPRTRRFDEPYEPTKRQLLGKRSACDIQSATKST